MTVTFINMYRYVTLKSDTGNSDLKRDPLQAADVYYHNSIDIDNNYSALKNYCIQNNYLMQQVKYNIMKDSKYIHVI